MEIKSNRMSISIKKIKMYKRLVIICLATVLSFFSCSKSENDVLQDSLVGTWSLVTIEGGLAQPVTYSKGEIVWFVNFDNNTITIKNSVEHNVGIQQNFSLNHTGVYDFSIITENDNEILVVGERKGTIKKEQGKFIIDYGVAFDDVRYTLIR